jgi:hypothetical protein
MNNEQKQPVLTRAQEIEQLEKTRKEAAARLKELKKKGVTYKVVETRKGLVGMTINGAGVPKFFYKEHLLDIIGVNEEDEAAQARREELRQWIAEHPELTDKE